MRGYKRAERAHNAFMPWYRPAFTRGKRLLVQQPFLGNIYTPEEEIIIRAAEKTGIYNSALDRMFPIVEHGASGRHNRFETTLAAFSGGHVAVIRGDAPGVISCCRYYTEKGRVHPLTTEKINELRLTAAQISKKAYRVVGIATRDTEYTSLTKLYTLQSDMTFEGLSAFASPCCPRGAQHQQCQEAGIKVIMYLAGHHRRQPFHSCRARHHTPRRRGAQRPPSQHDERRAFSAEHLPLPALRGSIRRRYEPRDRLASRKRREKSGCCRAGWTISSCCAARTPASPKALRFPPERKGRPRPQSLSSSGGRGIPVRVKDPSASSATGCEAVKFISDVYRVRAGQEPARAASTP